MIKLKKTKYVVKCYECQGLGFSRKLTKSGYEDHDCCVCDSKGTLPVFEETR